METTTILLPTLSSQIPVQLKNKILDIVVKELQDIKQKITNIENNKVLESLKFSDEDLKSIGIIKPEIKRKKRSRLLLEAEILEAQNHTDGAIKCAEYLGVGYNCYKKWAKTYGIFKINPWVKGRKKTVWSTDVGMYPLNQILNGKFPDYPVFRLRDRLILSGIKQPICENCGFNEKRITDNKMPLLISFKDGNEKNHILENIEILCYNCMFTMGRGYIRHGKVEFNFIGFDNT